MRRTFITGHFGQIISAPTGIGYALFYLLRQTAVVPYTDCPANHKKYGGKLRRVGLLFCFKCVAFRFVRALCRLTAYVDTGRRALFAVVVGAVCCVADNA